MICATLFFNRWFVRYIIPRMSHIFISTNCLLQTNLASTPALLTVASPGPPNDDFSRLAAGGQEPVDRVSKPPGLQPAVNLIASVLNVGEDGKKRETLLFFPPTELWSVTYLTPFWWRDLQMGPVSWQLYSANVIWWAEALRLDPLTV